MKKTNKINLNQLAKKAVDMKKNEMKTVNGGRQAPGGLCICPCFVLGDVNPTADYPVATNSNSAN